MSKQGFSDEKGQEAKEIAQNWKGFFFLSKDDFAQNWRKTEIFGKYILVQIEWNENFIIQTACGNKNLYFFEKLDFPVEIASRKGGFVILFL